MVDRHVRPRGRSLLSFERDDAATVADRSGRVGSAVRPVAPRAFETGDLIGDKYSVVATIGSGGMGVVLSARDTATNERVAIKVLRLTPGVDRATAIARFEREARTLARIESEHVLRVTDVGALEDGIPYMVTEYLEGEDLGQLLEERKALPIQEATGYLLQACEGVAAVHAAGVIHRDLKPSNLFLARRPDGTSIVKVLDFGVSKVPARAGDAVLSTTNALLGTPVYMAPEQLRASRHVDERADVWSLGLVLYELLCGARPFKGAHIPELCIAVMKGEARPISMFRSDVPEALQAILQRCMAKRASERFPTAAALANALAKFAPESARIHAQRASERALAVTVRVELPIADSVPPPVPPDDESKRTPRGGDPAGAPVVRLEPATLSLGGKGQRSRSWPRRVWCISLIGSIALGLVLGASGAREMPAPNVVAALPLLATKMKATGPSPASPSAPRGDLEVASVPTADTTPPPAGSAARSPSAKERVKAATMTQSPAPPSSANADTVQKDGWTWKWGDRD